MNFLKFHFVLANDDDDDKHGDDEVEDDDDDDGRFVGLVDSLPDLPLPLTASIGADRDANANEFTCERSLEFEVV